MEERHIRKRHLKKGVVTFIKIIILLFFIIFCYLIITKNPKPNDNPKPNGEEQEPGTPVVPVITTYLGTVTNSKNIGADELKLIVDFLDTYYKSISELKEYDMTKYFANTTSGDSLINQTAVSLLIDVRKQKSNDLSLSSAKYDLNIKSVEVTDEGTKISILENSYIHFSFMKEIETKVYNIKNEFTLKKVDGEYKISNFNKVQDFYVMITDKDKTGNSETLKTIKKDYLEIVKQKLNTDKINYQKYLNNTGLEAKTCDHKYDREAAYEYAINWVSERNQDWTTFSSNCQNYVSQVLIAGGIPMDYTGSASSNLQWKFYSNSYNTSEVNKGYVYTWTYVPSFYEYAKNNTGYGLCASVDANIYYAEAGDVIHVGTSGPTRHAVIVTGNYKKDGKVIDILVNSNTVDLENYPISAYAYPYVSMIKVFGWND